MLVKINKEALKRAASKGKLVLAAGLAGAVIFSSGCVQREVATNAHVKYDMIDTLNDKIATDGIQQILDVPNEDFKLVVDYKCALDDGAKWTITSDKEMYYEVSTMGLDPGYHVFVDNVHIDTSIKSYIPVVDGITQDTMDDRIHNGLMYGFPISDTNSYCNVNNIEGQNQDFIQGSFYGFNGYSSGTISQHRYVESDYLGYGVYANKISSVFDLIIEKSDGTVSCVSVPSNIVVTVWPYIEMVDSSGKTTYRYYYYDESDGKVKFEEISEEEYSQRTGREKTYYYK